MNKTGLNEGLIVFILILMDDITSLSDQIKQRFCQTDTHGVLKMLRLRWSASGRITPFPQAAPNCDTITLPLWAGAVAAAVTFGLFIWDSSDIGRCRFFSPPHNIIVYELELEAGFIGWCWTDSCCVWPLTRGLNQRDITCEQLAVPSRRQQLKANGATNTDLSRWTSCRSQLMGR